MGIQKRDWLRTRCLSLFSCRRIPSTSGKRPDNLGTRCLPHLDGNAVRFVGAARYAPAGYRSVGPKRGLLYGGPDYIARANETVLTIGQIESVTALENVDAIAAVPGLDMLYVGPADLAISMGLAPRQNSDDPILMAAVDKILAAAKRAGLRTGMHGSTAEYALKMFAKGFDLVTVTSDEALLAAGKAERQKIR